MRRVLTGYALSFNRRHKPILVEGEPYLLQLVRYIHLNPLRGSVVTTTDELGYYPWSGHTALLGRVDYPWQDCKHVLTHFGRTVSAAPTYQGAG